MRGTAGLLAVFWATSAAPAAASAPDLATCPVVSEEPNETERTKPLPVPAALRTIMKAKMSHFAVATLTGTTICIDTMGMGSTDPITLSPDRRFVSFGWLGYETYGHLVVDRTGNGEIIETVVAPVFSPSRRFFAATEQTELDSGLHTGLAIWEAGRSGTTEVGRIGETAGAYDLRITRWVGESCIDLTGVEQDVVPEILDKQPRVRFRADARDGAWQVTRSPPGCTER